MRERNPLYWNNDATIIEEVVSLVINDENVALTRYMAGELDRTEVPAGQYPNLLKSNPDEAVSFPRLCSYYYTFNMSDSGPEAFKDVRVRQALSYAIDRTIIVENILQGGQFPAYTFTPDSTANFEVPEVEYAVLQQSERDAVARQLLTDAGVRRRQPAEIRHAVQHVRIAKKNRHRDVADVEAETGRAGQPRQHGVDNFPRRARQAGFSRQ